MKKPGKREERTRNGPSGREKREENKQCRADGKKRAITNRTGVVGLEEATGSPLIASIMLTTASMLIGTKKIDRGEMQVFRRRQALRIPCINPCR